MDRSHAESKQPRLGGTISLAKFVSEHREAIDFDLLTKTGKALNEVGRGLSWASLNAFVKNTPPDGALMRELNPELYQWATIAKTNALLADIYDLLAWINANLCAKGSGKRAKPPKPYPRPQKKDKKKIGTPLPLDELNKRIFGEQKR